MLAGGADLLASLDSEVDPAAYVVHVCASACRQRRLSYELPGKLVNELHDAQAEAESRVLR